MEEDFPWEWLRGSKRPCNRTSASRVRQPRSSGSPPPQDDDATISQQHDCEHNQRSMLDELEEAFASEEAQPYRNVFEAWSEPSLNPSSRKNAPSFVGGVTSSARFQTYVREPMQ